MAYEVPAHHLAAPRPAPIAFPVAAGLSHGDSHFADEEQPGEPLAPVLAEKHSTPMGEA